MDRNQFDISDDDQAEMREQSRAADQARVALTPAQQHVERDAQAAAQVSRAKEQKARKKAEKDAAAAALEEDQRQFEVYAEGVVQRWAARGIDFPRPEWRHTLFRLSEENYTAYLLMPQWKAIRRRVLKRDRGICRVCGTKAQCVHHISYEQDVMVGVRESKCGNNARVNVGMRGLAAIYGTNFRESACGLKNFPC